MERTKVTSWAFLKEMFGPNEKIGIMAYEAKGQAHRATVKSTQMVKTCGEALSPEFTKRLQYLNARGLNIVVGINPLLDSATTRTKDSVKEIRHLIADIDTRNDDVTGKIVTGKERLDAMLADPKCPKPYFILNTSPENYQAVWRVEGFSREQAEATQRALGAYYGGDRNISTDISRGVRLPGLHNKKYEETFPVKCDYGAKVVHRPESFSYLPQPEDITRQSTVTPLADELKAYNPAHEPPDRSRKEPAATRNVYSNVGADTSGSGRDWAYCNREIAVGLRKQGIAQFDSIVASLRPYLEESARERRKGNPRYYAEHTIKKLKSSWQGRLHEFAFEPQQRQAAAEGGKNGSVAPHPTPSSPAAPAADITPASIPTSGLDYWKTPGMLTPDDLDKIPWWTDKRDDLATERSKAQYTPGPEDKKHDAFCVRQDLIEGNSPKQIYDNMMEWRFKETPGAEVYLTNLILEQQRLLRAEELVPTLQVILQQSSNELDVFRKLLNMQVPGEGVLLTAVTALDQLAKDQWSNGSVELLRQVGSPATSEAARDQAFRLATLGFTHGDSVSGVEQALTAKYHPNLAHDNTPPYLSQLVQQAQAAQAIAISNKEREHIR